LGSLDVHADGAQVVRVAMLPSLAQLAACLALALAVGVALTARYSALPGRRRAGGWGAHAGGVRDSFVPLYALSCWCCRTSPGCRTGRRS